MSIVVLSSTAAAVVLYGPFIQLSVGNPNVLEIKVKLFG